MSRAFAWSTMVRSCSRASAECSAAAGLLVLPEQRDRRAEDRLHVRRRRVGHVVGGDAGADRRLHELGVVLVDEQRDRAGISRGELAQAFERVAVGPRHVHQDDIRRMRGHRLQQGFAGTQAQDGDAGIGGKLLRQQANPDGVVVGQQDLHTAGVRACSGSRQAIPGP